MSYLEAQEYQYGDREEFDRLERIVSPEVGRSWIAYARENVNPLIQPEQIREIQEWYSNELRQLNHEYARNKGVGQDMPVPVNARVVANTIRSAVAFARVGLQDKVSQQNVDRAKTLQKKLVGQTFDDGEFVPYENQRSKKPETQEDKMDAIKQAATKSTLEEIATETGLDESEVDERLSKLKRKGDVYEPTQGVFHAI